MSTQTKYNLCIARMTLSSHTIPIHVMGTGHQMVWTVLEFLTKFDAAVKRNQKWRPMYYKGTRTAKAPPPPIKFLDIGTKMALYETRESIPKEDDRFDILHPRFEGRGTPRARPFHAVIHERLEKSRAEMMAWCKTSAWFDHSINYDVRVKNSYGYIWGRPLLVPHFLRSSSSWVPERKYVDIVTDTLHASSSDLITWNTLIMKKLGWNDAIPRMWLEITASSLEEWRQRDQKPPFLLDNRRGDARVKRIVGSPVVSGVSAFRSAPTHPATTLKCVRHPSLYDHSSSTPPWLRSCFFADGTLMSE